MGLSFFSDGEHGTMYMLKFCTATNDLGHFVRKLVGLFLSVR